MKTEKSTDTGLGFPRVPGGTYVWEILEGVRILENEDTGAVSQSLSLQVDSVVDGDGQVGDKASWLINVITGKGTANRMADETYQRLLTATNLMDDLSEKAGGEDVDVASDKFVAFIKAKLPGKFVEATHQLKDNNMNFTDVRAVSGDKKGEEKAKKETSGGDEW